jgi:uncharacterized protein YciI
MSVNKISTLPSSSAMKRLPILLIFFCQAALAQPKTYTIVFLNKRVDAEQISKDKQEELMKGHMANINALAKEGKLLAAGPFDGGGGLFVLNTTSTEEASSWVNTDPAVRANRWRVEILPYIPRAGSICPVGEPYEMVSYTFVRFSPLVQKFTASSYPDIMKKHDDFLGNSMKDLTVVTEAIFGDNDGGILILKESITKDAFAKDPGVEEGLLDIDVKKLYIARGSFCEK